MNRFSTPVILLLGIILHVFIFATISISEISHGDRLIRNQVDGILLNAYERVLIKKVNAFRSQNDLSPLKHHEELSKMAQDLGYIMAHIHSNNRIATYKRWEKLTKGTPLEAMKIEINMKAAFEMENPLDKTLETWFSEKTSRNHLVNPQVTHTGVGVVLSDQDYLLVIQVYAEIQDPKQGYYLEGEEVNRIKSYLQQVPNLTFGSTFSYVCTLLQPFIDQTNAIYTIKKAPASLLIIPNGSFQPNEMVRLNFAQTENNYFGYISCQTYAKWDDSGTLRGMLEKTYGKDTLQPNGLNQPTYWLTDTHLVEYRALGASVATMELLKAYALTYVRFGERLDRIPNYWTQDSWNEALRVQIEAGQIDLTQISN